MTTEWLTWAGMLFALIVLFEVVRLNVIFLAALKSDIRITGLVDCSEPCDHVPLVSVVVPAKDEEAHVEQCVRSILATEYDRLEVLLVNDRSQDATLQIMNRLAQEDTRVKVLSIDHLPEGWTGKTHAMFQAAQKASGEILLFTDADAIMNPSVLSRAMTYFVDNCLDMLSLLPGFTRRGFLEDAVYPHLAFGLSYFYPLPQVNDEKNPAGLASGCFIMIRREVYEQVGTWAELRREVTEDVALSKLVKAKGWKLRVLRAGEMVLTRPFERLTDLCRFWKRTYYGGLEKSASKMARLLTNYVALSLLSALCLWSGISLVKGEPTLPTVLLFIATALVVAAVTVPAVVFIRQEDGHWPYGLTAPVGIAVAAWVALSTLMTVMSNEGIRWRGSLYK